MKAFVLAAGLGTRLRPFTLEHPKALVPVGGVPMLQRVLLRLKGEGFDEVIINVHHFADQIEEFLAANGNFGLRISISAARAALLDTGGALLHAARLIGEDDEPMLVHNVDILSDAPLRRLMQAHKESGRMATLLVSSRESSRRLAFDSEDRLCGWTNLADGSTKPAGFKVAAGHRLYAFSGIHAVTPSLLADAMRRQGRGGAFPIVDFYLDESSGGSVGCFYEENLRLIDIGKPATLAQADTLIKDYGAAGNDRN